MEGKVCFISDAGSGGQGWGRQGRAAGVFLVDAPGECWLMAKLYCQIRLCSFSSILVGNYLNSGEEGEEGVKTCQC